MPAYSQQSHDKKISVNNGLATGQVNWPSTSAPNISVGASSINLPSMNNGSISSASHSARYTDEDIIEQILKVQASKEEILNALKEVYPEKFI